MRKCEKCQTMNQKHSKFCVSCGASFEPKKKNKKWLPLLLMILAIVVVGVLVKVTFLDKNNDDENIQNSLEDDENNLEDADEPAIDYELEDLEESFELIEEEIITTEALSLQIDDFYPKSGTFGTVINIEGQLLANEVYDIQLNGISMPVYHMDHHLMQVIVTKEMSSGSLVIVYENEDVTVGDFEVTEPQLTSLMDVMVPVSSEDLVFQNDEIIITIPSGALQAEKRLTVEKYESNNHVHHLAEFIHQGVVYAINMEDQTTFEVPLLIEFPNIPDTTAEPMTMYYDESSYKWIPIESRKTEHQSVVIETNHLTDYWYDLWYEKVMSPDGYFSVYYEKNDSFYAEGYGDLLSLVNQVAMDLDIARKQYDTLTSHSLPTGQDVLMHSKQNLEGGYYSPDTGTIFLPTNYKSALSVDTTAAHELFHRYQNLDMNMFTMYKNKWLVEASAEYVSYRLAFPNQSYVPQVWNGATPDVSMTHLNGVQEYAMAAFLDYLLMKENKNFKDLYKSFVTSSSDYTTEFVNFFKTSNQDFSITQVYEEFWKQVTTDNTPKRVYDPKDLFVQNKNLNSTGTNLTFKYQTSALDTQQFIRIVPYRMNPNVPVRYLKVTADLIDNKPAVAFGLQLLSVPEKNMVAAMSGGGLIWDQISHAFYGGTYKIFPMEENDMLLLAVQGLAQSAFVTTHVKEVNVKCMPEKIENMIPGEVQNFKFIFSNLYKESKEFLVEVDFGDGVKKEKTYSGVDHIGIETKHVYKDIKDVKFTATLYDVTDGKKEIISKLVIPVTSEKEVKIEANHTVFKVNEKVELTANIQNDKYRYVWSFGDKDGSREEGTFKSSFTYDEKGAYTVSVNVFDGDDKFIGAGSLDLTCNDEEESNNDAYVTPQIILSNNNPVVGDPITFSTNVYDSDYVYEFYYNGAKMIYNGRETESGYVNYEKYNMVSLSIKDKDGNEIDYIELSFDAEKPQYEWALVETKINNATNVDLGFGSSYSATASDGLFDGDENYKGEYNIHSQLSYPAFAKSYSGGEEVVLPIELIITNIDELKNGNNNSAFFNSLTFHVDSKVELVSEDGTRTDDGYLTAQLKDGNTTLVSFTQGYAFDEPGPDRIDVKLHVYFNEVFLINPGKEKKVATITFHFGDYEDTDATVTYVFETKRTN